MKMLSALVIVVFFSISITGFVLAREPSPESGILVQSPIGEELEKRITIPFTWLLRPFSIQDGCLVNVYHSKNGHSVSESLEFKVAVLIIPFGEDAEVPGYSNSSSWMVRCNSNGRISTALRQKRTQ